MLLTNSNQSEIIKRKNWPTVVFVSPSGWTLDVGNGVCSNRDRSETFSANNNNVVSLTLLRPNGDCSHLNWSPLDVYILKVFEINKITIIFVTNQKNILLIS